MTFSSLLLAKLGWTSEHAEAVNDLRTQITGSTKLALVTQSKCYAFIKKPQSDSGLQS